MTEQPVRVEIDKQDLQDLFDIAVGSLDFGSGFLDKGETVALRRIARALGVDTERGTPSNVRTYFAHVFEPVAHDDDRCGARDDYHLPRCLLPSADPIHNGVSFDDPEIES